MLQAEEGSEGRFFCTRPSPKMVSSEGAFLVVWPLNMLPKRATFRRRERKGNGGPDPIALLAAVRDKVRPSG